MFRERHNHRAGVLEKGGIVNRRSDFWDDILPKEVKRKKRTKKCETDVTEKHPPTTTRFCGPLNRQSNWRWRWTRRSASLRRVMLPHVLDQSTAYSGLLISR